MKKLILQSLITLLGLIPGSAIGQEIAEIFLVSQDGLTVTLTTTTQAPVGNTLYQWNFSDNTSDQAGPTITHTFTSPGTYTVTLTLNDSPNVAWWAQGTFTMSVGADPCNMQALISHDNQQNGLVSFHVDSIVGGTAPYIYDWYFSNGVQSTIENPEFIFQNGSYFACLTVYDAEGCVDSVCTDFNVTDGICPQNFITVDYQVNNNNMFGTVMNTNFGNGPIDLTIDYGDGTLEQQTISSVYSIQHDYQTSGIYYLCATGVDGNGCSSIFCIDIIVDFCDIESSFSFENLLNGQVQFNVDSVSGGTAPYTYYWWFGDGQQSTEENPQAVFENGVYTACLTVQDAQGCFDSTCTVFTVNNGICPSEFIIVDYQIGVNELWGIVFNENFNAFPIELILDYGDGTLEEQTITNAYTFQHIYTQPGVYFVCAIGTDANGCIAEFCFDVEIDPCQGFTPFFTYNQQANVVDFFSGIEQTDTSDVSYFWDFGDGNTSGPSEDWFASHVFEGEGVYTVCLEAVDANGCSSTTCQQVVVLGPCESLFVNPAVSTSGFDATLQAFATGQCGNYQYEWLSIETGETGNEETFNPTYTAAGTYGVVLTVTDDCGCSQTLTIPVTISCNSIPNANDAIFMITGESTTCSSYFYDTGGLNGNYLNNQNATVTVYPETPGSKLKVTFLNFNTETNFDYLTIHNGNSANSPLLTSLNGSLTNNGPIEYVSSAADGSLTFVWDSDISVTSSGWQAIFSCVDLSVNAEDLGDGLFQVNAESVENWSSYEWTFNGIPYEGSESSVTEQFIAGDYIEACVTVTNALGCSESACTNFLVPCNYDMDIEVTSNGNEVEIVINNYEPSYFYSVFSQNTQFWQQITGPTTTLEFLSPINEQICIFADGNCFDSTCVDINLDPAGAELVAGFVWNDDNGNGLFDENETPIIDSYVTLCAGNDSISCLWTYTDENGYYEFLVFPGEYTVSSFVWDNLLVQTLPAGNNVYEFTLDAGVELTGFDFGYQSQAVTIEGTLFYDTNNNGIQDAGEQGVANKFVQIGNTIVSTNANGDYSFVTVPGTYGISLYNPLVGYAVTIPASLTYSIDASTIGVTYGGNDFGFWADPELMDISANVYPISTVTPGFSFLANLSYCNNGATAASGEFTYYWDPILEITSAAEFSPQPSSFNPDEASATWIFTDLQPGDCDYIFMSPPMPVDLELGAQVVHTVIATPLDDYNPTNNIDTLHMVVVGSYDPNDKQGNPAGIGEEGKILPNTELEFTIRFQNTGTAPAVNVVLIDTITSDFVLETFDMIASSDEYTVEVDPSTRVISWTFTNIMLPDSASDPLGSIGFVRFRLNPVQDQPDGTVLNNFADIYFDFNEPIRTNTTVHTIDRFLSVNDVDNNLNVQVYPNPFKGFTNILINTEDNSDAVITITDVVGKTIDSFTVKSGKMHQYNASHLASGVYMYSVSNKTSKATGKLIVQ